MGDAQDVAQEAFARAWQRWDAVRGYESPEAWVRRVATNLATSRHRRNRTARAARWRPPQGEAFGAEPPTLGHGYLGWTTASAASYVASTSSLAAATLTDGSTTYGDVQAAGSFVLAASSPDPKQGSLRLSVLRAATIERLMCVPARRARR